MDCPNCRLVNPNTALRCDCGYDFQTGKIKESYVSDAAGGKARLADRRPDRGVGGWLLLLCLSLTVFSPLLTLGSLAVGFAESSKYFAQFHGLLVINVVDTLLSVSLMAFSIYAGVRLWGIRPGAVRMAKIFLLCFLAYLAVAAVLPFMAGLPSAANAAMIGVVAINTFRGVIYFAIWYSYLNTSKRVRATYQLESR